jgi:molecular chaperone IbpA
VLNNNTLTISGSQVREQDSTVEYLHQGISARHFERTFTLAEHVVVKSAEVVDGILVVAVEYIVPEEKKARTIEIK